ncbi:hypothetical protein OPT61_g3535 [Boeremia exigua]|uniref:Uncharacterized protein n=1 Tax=Boeremia exigua TaxID=749465 RepID=A0ACC2IHP2_9PLEO|nr:hypothetical protein OPT61_g3535 [Boeremia exigua]
MTILSSILGFVHSRCITMALEVDASPGASLFDSFSTYKTESVATNMVDKAEDPSLRFAHALEKLDTEGEDLSKLEQPNPVSTTPAGAPKIRHMLEYRLLKDETLLFAKDLTGSQTSRGPTQKRQHDGPIFDIVDINYSVAEDQPKNDRSRNDGSEKETKADEAKADEANAPEVLRHRGRQFIRIYSRPTINALQSVVEYYPRQTIVGHPVEIREPYAVLVHHWDELKELRKAFDPVTATYSSKDCEMTDTFEHLGLLLEFLEEKLGDRVRQEKERWAKPIPSASYEMLWLLLKPGIDVYFNRDDEDSLNSSLEPGVLSRVDFTVQNETWDNISRFSGETPINKLRTYPAIYAEQAERKRDQMIERGKRYFNLRRKQCMYFDGIIDEIFKKQYSGYVMLDPEQQEIDKTFLPNGANVGSKLSGLRFCSCDRCSDMDTAVTRPAKFDGYEYIFYAEVTGLTDHQYFLCPRSVEAFLLDLREWRTLLLDGFQQARWNPSLIDSLVLRPEYKSMIQNLCRIFIDPASLQLNKDVSQLKPWAADYVENKGKGMIFLLHGRPGVGKTYTAECIANTMQRPLLSVSCSDIGVDPSQVEVKLRRWFDIARSWNAITLLDEADIYMEYRQLHDLERNSLVAGFLRAVEYYDGVLFLTTNRIGTFDEAFLSRITAIYYGDFTDDDRERVWNTYFDKLEGDREDIYVPESTKDYVTNEEVRSLQWNGREIRNAFQVAVNLAQAENSRDKKNRILVKRSHIKVTVDLSSDFKAYMKSARKTDESKRAAILGIRNDEYTSPRKPA